MSLSARRAWIEITVVGVLATLVTSLSARRAWIEMALPELVPLADPVALRKESVDRNLVVWAVAHVCYVALRKESVDRNQC